MIVCYFPNKYCFLNDQKCFFLLKNIVLDMFMDIILIKQIKEF